MIWIGSQLIRSTVGDNGVRLAGSSAGLANVHIDTSVQRLVSYNIIVYSDILITLSPIEQIAAESNFMETAYLLSMFLSSRPFALAERSYSLRRATNKGSIRELRV